MQSEINKASREFCRGRFNRTSKSLRGYIFQERVGCEQKQYNTSTHTAMIKADNANLMTLET